MVIPSMHALRDSNAGMETCAAFSACIGTFLCKLMCRPQELVADAAADIRCEVCRNPEDEEQMILCDSCDKGYHIFCLYVLLIHFIRAHPIRTSKAQMTV